MKKKNNSGLPHLGGMKVKINAKKKRNYREPNEKI